MVVRSQGQNINVYLIAVELDFLLQHAVHVLFIYLLWFECIRAPQIHMLKSIPQCDGIRRWGLWEVIRSCRKNRYECIRSL